MTERGVISRSEFVKRFQSVFDEIFDFDVAGKCIVKNLESWEALEFPEMTLSGWSIDSTIFQHSLDFIMPVSRVNWFVLTEVESIERFTESQVISANRNAIEKLWLHSFLPHFNAVCFDDSAKWCAVFDNFNDRVSFYRKKFVAQTEFPRP